MRHLFMPARLISLFFILMPACAPEPAPEAEPEGPARTRLTTDSATNYYPCWSPDGKTIAYQSNQDGNRDIWVMPADGGPARQLTDHEAQDWRPAWSPDGQMIAFSSLRAGNSDIWVVPSGGGEARQLTTDPGTDDDPEWSPDGDWVYFRSNRNVESRLWRVPADGGEPEPVTTGQAYLARRSVDGKRMLFKGSGNLSAVSLQDGAETLVADFEGRWGGTTTLSFATDGQSVYFAWGSLFTDL